MLTFMDINIEAAQLKSDMIYYNTLIQVFYLHYNEDKIKNIFDNKDSWEENSNNKFMILKKDKFLYYNSLRKKTTINLLETMYDLGYRIAAIPFKKYSETIYQTINDISKNKSRYYQDARNALEKIEKLTLRLDDEDYLITSMLIPLSSLSVERFAHIGVVKPNNFSNDIYGATNKDYPTYIQAYKKNHKELVRPSIESQNSKEHLLLLINPKDLFKKRKIYVDPEGINYPEEAGKSFFVLGGIPASSIEEILSYKL